MRQQMAFLAPAEPETFAQKVFPVWTVLSPEEAWYGFPLLREGYVKIAEDSKVECTEPEAERQPSPSFLDQARTFVAQHLPVLEGPDWWGAAPACTPIRPTTTSSSTGPRWRGGFSSPAVAAATDLNSAAPLDRL